jgi:long-subunit acyl-CoA synthetase (AMP-forming)
LSEAGAAVDQGTLKAELENLLDEINGEVPPYEKVGQIYVVPEWTIENAMLTPTMKLKRNLIEQSYREQIEANLGGERVNFL